MISLLTQFVDELTTLIDFIFEFGVGIINSISNVIDFILSAIGIINIFANPYTSAAYIPSIMVVGLGLVFVACIARIIIQLL